MVSLILSVSFILLYFRVEPNRMKELAGIEKSLKPLFKKNAPQIWLGDYNRWVRFRGYFFK